MISAVFLPALAACGDSANPFDSVRAESSERPSAVREALDVLAAAKRPASIVVLNNNVDETGRLRFERTLRRMGGDVLATLPPRLMIATLPPRASALLAQLGVAARFDRAVLPGEIPNATLPESRFAAVYSNRWHPTQVASAGRIVPRKAARTDEPFEDPPVMAAPAWLASEDPEDRVATPYATGTVLVSVILPESNGSFEASTENWNEARIREAYLEVQTALDDIAESEPNANLRFLMHFESAPAPGGLAGTVETGYEYGKHAQYNNWQDESLVLSDVLSKILQRPIPPDQADLAVRDRQLSLRKQYKADAAFLVIVAANHNGTASLRAHVRYGWATLHSRNGSDVFTHEFGHIFGATDEYCPDACSSPVSLQGYLGIYSANSTFRVGDTGGINNGQGEMAPSLMASNVVTAINGYTRGAWGWLDRDGDGIIEVRDTYPQSQLEASVAGQVIRLTGQIVDRPEASGFTPYSVNHLTSLEVEIERAGTILDTIDITLPGDVRGRQLVDTSLPPLPQGQYLLRVRAKNEVGNVEAQPFVLHATIAATDNTPPIPHLTLPNAMTISSSRSWSVSASAVDPEGETSEVRIDLGADGTFDTPWGPPRSLDFTPPAGIHPIAVEARDPSGATASTRGELLVFDGDAPPRVRLDPVPSTMYGTTSAPVTLTARATDPEGGALEYSFVAELATSDGTFRTATGWGTSNLFSVALPAPARLSRVYRLTAEARDSAGAVVRDTRTVHLNPYDHAPAITRVDREQGRLAGEQHVFALYGSDPDGSQMWNPDLFYRVDWEGDGTFDMAWFGMPASGTFVPRLFKVFDRAGTYHAVFELRDGYYAAHRLPYTIIVE